MTIKISQLTALTSAQGIQGNILIPVVSNVTGVQTTVRANITQIAEYITGGAANYGNIVPRSNIAYSLGNITNQWKDIYVSSNTIYVGGTALSVSDSTLLLDGYAIAGAGAATSSVGTTAGTNWSYANIGNVFYHPGRYLISSAYGNNVFVSIETGSLYPNAAVYSSDGINWYSTSMPNVVQTSYQVTYGGNTFVAIYAGTGNTATSTDGITWNFNQDVIPSAGVNGYEWYQNLVAYGNGRFVALTGYNTRRSVISTDGITWSNGAMSTGSVTDLPATDRQGYSQWYQSIAFTNGVFVASSTRADGTGGNLIAYTTDGIVWGNIQLPWGHNLTTGYLLGAGDGIFVGVPKSGGGIGIRSTDAGITWSNISLPSVFTYTSVLYGNGKFILLPSGAGGIGAQVTGDANIAVSTDGGISWTSISTPYNQYTSGAFGGSTFIGTGIYTIWNNISYSTNSVDATPIGIGIPSTGAFTDVTVGGSLDVVGEIISPTIDGLSSDIGNVSADITTANTAIKGYIDATIAANIANVGGTTYGNSNVASYLSSYSGNVDGVFVGNVLTDNYFYANGAVISFGGGTADTGNIVFDGNTIESDDNIIRIRSNSSYWQFDYATGLQFPDSTVQTTAYTGGSSNYGNSNVAVYLPTYTGIITASNVAVNGNITAQYLFGNASQLSGLPTTYSNVNVGAYVTTNGLTNYSNVNAAAYTTSMGHTNYSNVNVAAYVTTNALSNYANVNVKAYTESMGFKDFSNANVSSYLTSYTGNISAGNINVSNNITANAITSVSAGTPTLSSSTNLNLTANNAVVVTSSVFRLASFTTAGRANLSPTSGDIIYNSSVGNVQVYSGNTWYNLTMTVAS